jgi:hypothetical protein
MTRDRAGVFAHGNPAGVAKCFSTMGVDGDDPREYGHGDIIQLHQIGGNLLEIEATIIPSMPTRRADSGVIDRVLVNVGSLAL